MKFKYQARTKESELQAGFVEAANRDRALDTLSGHDLFILSIEEVSKPRWYDRVGAFFSRVRRKDMVIFTRQLSILLEAQLPLTRVLRTLHDQTTNPTLKEAVLQVAEDVDSGLSLSQGFERQPGVFSDFFVSMIRSAEVTGGLDQVSGFLADYTEREATLATKAYSALIYPALILGLFLVVAFVMIAFVFPQIQPVFEQSGVPLPAFAKVLLGVGVFLGKWWFVVISLIFILVIMGIDYFGTAEGKALKDDLKIRMPIIRRAYLPVTLARFANAGAMLIKGGVPVAQAMEIVGETIDNVLYRDILHEVSENVRQGKTLSESIAKHVTYFPPLISQMLAVGETTGQLDQIFMRIANFYSKEADTIVGNLVELIQPLLIIGIGLMVFLLFSSILLPLYQLTATIQ